VAVNQVSVILLKKFRAEFAVFVPAYAVIQPVNGRPTGSQIEENLTARMEPGKN